MVKLYIEKVINMCIQNQNTITKSAHFRIEKHSKIFFFFLRHLSFCLLATITKSAASHVIIISPRFCANK